MVAQTQVIRPWKELDLQLLHIGRMDLVIEGCFEDPLAQCATVAGSQALPEWARHNLRRGSRFCKGKVVRTQLRKDDRQLHGMGVVDWISSRIGPITGRFLDLR